MGPAGSLARAALGAELRVVAVEPERRSALAQEGVVEGAVVVVERRLALGGPLIVRLGRTRLALARRVAADVAVTPVAPMVPVAPAVAAGAER
jgi:Fe2+ transport system protein FeoA